MSRAGLTVLPGPGELLPACLCRAAAVMSSRLAGAPLRAAATLALSPCSRATTGSPLPPTLLPASSRLTCCSELLEQQKPLHQLAVQWGCSLPRGLQAVLAAGPGPLPADKPSDAAACAFGGQLLRAGWGPCLLLHGMMAAYKPCLEALRGSPFGSQPQMSGSAEGVQKAGPGSCGPPSPGWQQRSQQMQQWQQEGSGKGARLPGAREASATAATARPRWEQQEQALAPTPPMEWAEQPWHAAAPAKPAQQQQQQQRPHCLPADARTQQHRPRQWQPEAHPPRGGQPSGPGLQPDACQTAPWGRHPQQSWGSNQQAPQAGTWAQPAGLPQQAGIGQEQEQQQQRQLQQQEKPPWVPAVLQAQQWVLPAQHAAPLHPPTMQQLPGQGAKRGMPYAPAGVAAGSKQDQPGEVAHPVGIADRSGPGCSLAPPAASMPRVYLRHSAWKKAITSCAFSLRCAAKKRYLRSKIAEAAVRNRTDAGATGSGSAAALDAAQRAAFAHEVAAAAGEGESDSDADFQEAPGRR